MNLGRTLSGQVANTLLRQIQEGTFKPGDRLPTLKQLAETHGVGYGVAREAMQHLVALGLVDVRPNRGAIVKWVEGSAGLDDTRLALLLSDQAVAELYDLRLVVEVSTAGQAAENATAAHLRAIRAAHQAFETALNAGLPVHDRDVELHSVIAEASGNALFIRVLGALRGVLAEFRAQAIRVPHASEVALVEHAAVLEAIEQRRPDAAREAMRKHLETAKTTVMVARREQSSTKPSPAAAEDTDSSDALASGP